MALLHLGHAGGIALEQLLEASWKLPGPCRPKKGNACNGWLKGLIRWDATQHALMVTVSLLGTSASLLVARSY